MRYRDRFKGPIEIEERCTSIMLTDAYTEWFTPMEKGSFPQICEDANSWQQMIEANIFRRCIGVRSPGTSGKKMPSLLFEQPERPPSGYSQILNTDYYTNSRVLQYKSLGAGNYSVSHGGHLLYFSGEISFDTPDLDKYLKSLEDETSLSCGSLRLILREGRMALSWGGTDLTKDQHMSTSVCINGNWYHSSSARWNIKKLSEDLLVAEGFWHELSVVQIWTVELTGKDSFIWKIGMRVDKDIHIQQQHMELMFTPSYDRWFSDYDTGGFPLQFLELEQDSVQRCIPDGIVGLQGKEERYPALNVGFSDKIGNFAKVFNSDFYSKARVVRIDKVEKEADATLSPGKYRCFETEVSIGKARPVDIGSQANILEADGIKFAFDAGSGRIYWKGEEQTKRLGLYSSLRSGGRWHTSASSAIWKLENKDASAISAIGRWRYLPLTQYWQIRLLPEGSIGFKVDMQVDDEIEIDRLQMSLMLSERYLQWFRGKDDKGEFPPFRGDVDDDWDCIWSGRDKVCIGVTGGDGDGHLPQVLFNPEGLDEDWSLTIVNSDIYHRGRVLQLCNTKKALLKPGQYAYAQGKITVGNLLW